MKNNDFTKDIHLRWSDMDPNFHARHSVYYDFAAQIRTEFLFSHGLTAKEMSENNIGPILFREEAVFRKELRYGDKLTINLLSTKLRRDGSRFSVRHEIKREGEVCATVTVDGAWIDTTKRKLTVPPEVVFKTFDAMPKSEDFEWQEG